MSVKIDRERAGISGVTTEEIARSLVTATSSSRFVVPNYWPDPKSGIGYFYCNGWPGWRLRSSL